MREHIIKVTEDCARLLGYEPEGIAPHGTGDCIYIRRPGSQATCAKFVPRWSFGDCAFIEDRLIELGYIIIKTKSHVAVGRIKGGTVNEVQDIVFSADCLDELDRRMVIMEAGAAALALLSKKDETTVAKP